MSDVIFASKPLSGCHLIWIGITLGTMPAIYEGAFDETMYEYRVRNIWTAGYPFITSVSRHVLHMLSDAFSICNTPEQTPDWFHLYHGQQEDLSEREFMGYMYHSQQFYRDSDEIF